MVQFLRNPALSSRTSIAASHVLAEFWAVAALRVRLEIPLELCLPGHEVAVGAHFVESPAPLAKPLCLLHGLQRLLSLTFPPRAARHHPSSASMRSSSSTLYCVGPMLSCCCLASEIHFRSADLGRPACLLFVRSPTAFWILCLASRPFLSALSCFSSLFFSLSSTLIDLAGPPSWRPTGVVH